MLIPLFDQKAPARPRLQLPARVAWKGLPTAFFRVGLKETPKPVVVRYGQTGWLHCVVPYRGGDKRLRPVFVLDGGEATVVRGVRLTVRDLYFGDGVCGEQYSNDIV